MIPKELPKSAQSEQDQSLVHLLPDFVFYSRLGAEVLTLMTFMNKDMQSKKQRNAVKVIIAIVLIAFIVSIVAVAFY